MWEAFIDQSLIIESNLFPELKYRKNRYYIEHLKKIDIILNLSKYILE